MNIPTVTFIAAALLMPRPVHSQRLFPGDRVRVTSAGVAGTLVGTIMSATADTINLAVSVRRRGIDRVDVHQYQIPAATIEDVEVSLGWSRTAGAPRGFVVGLGLGVVTSFLILYDLQHQEGDGGEIALMMALSAPPLFSMAGAGFGFLFGTERWRRVF